MSTKLRDMPGMETLRRSPTARKWLADKGFSGPEEYEAWLTRKEQTIPWRRKAHAEGRELAPPQRHFIMWDGEGITMPDGSHRYVIFANSEGDSIVDPNGLSTQAIFELMLRSSDARPRAINVIFAGNYDANMWLLPSLTRARAKRLSKLGKCTLTLDGVRYGIDYQPRHLFSVRELVFDPHKGPGGSFVKRRGITVWDIFGSYQCSFVKACRGRLDEKDLADIEEIERMKGRRSGFTLDDLDEMVLSAGGRIYFAKDARLSHDKVHAMYPRLGEFLSIKDRVDPEHRLVSDLSRRLHIGR